MEPLTYAATLYGAPRTKKNTPRVFVSRGRPVVLPNLLWCAWRDTARFDPPLPPRVQLEHLSWARLSRAKRKGRQRPASLLPTGRTWVLDATIYREAARGDADNYVVGLLDLLVARGVIEDDKRVALGNIVVDKDKESPRVEVRLTEVVR